MTELAEAIRGLLMLAYPGDMPEGTNAALARDAFLTALNDPDLEERIRDHEPKTLDQACKIAQRLEVVRNAVRAESSVQRGHQARQVNEHEEEYEEPVQSKGKGWRRDR